MVGWLVLGERLAAACDDSQAVVFKITEAIKDRKLLFTPRHDFFSLNAER